MKNFFNEIYCFFKGHSNPEIFIHETDSWITTERCCRCKTILFNGLTWKLKHTPPLNSTPEQIILWEKYCEYSIEEVKRNAFRIGVKQILNNG